MRPPSHPQDPLRYPLNTILTSEGNVRILRVLTSVDSPIGRTEVARKAQLQPSGVRRALDRLADLGLIEVTGSGRNLAVRLRDRYPLASSLRSLFATESALWKTLIDSLKAAIADYTPSLKAVWIENPATRRPGTIDIGVLGSADSIDSISSAIEDDCRTIENDFATHIVIHAYTEAELLIDSPERSQRLEQVTLLHGWIPLRWRVDGRGPIRSHQDLETRARTYASAVADRLVNDPSLIGRALAWIERQLDASGVSADSDLQEWKSILEQLSVPQIQSFLTEDSERARRLRQSNPLLEILTAEERQTIIREIPDDQR